MKANYFISWFFLPNLNLLINYYYYFGLTLISKIYSPMTRLLVLVNVLESGKWNRATVSQLSVWEFYKAHFICEINEITLHSHFPVTSIVDKFHSLLSITNICLLLRDLLLGCFCFTAHSLCPLLFPPPITIRFICTE